MATPVFDRLPPAYKMNYDQFFHLTHPDRILYMRNLDQLTDLAHVVRYIFECANPSWNPRTEHWGDQNRFPALQWHLDQISAVKERLANAIYCKRRYYENTFYGKITKFFLRMFGLWNRGNTAAIQRAEDFLLKADLRYPVQKIGNTYRFAYYPGVPRGTFFACFSVQQHLNATNFYHYEPNRAIEVQGGRNEEMPRFMVGIAPG